VHATHPHPPRLLALALAASLLLALCLALAPRLATLDLGGSSSAAAPAEPAIAAPAEPPAWVDGPLQAMRERAAWPERPAAVAAR
jgi:hypothetical protein